MEVPLLIADIEIEEIFGDIADGVSLKSLKDINLCPPVYKGNRKSCYAEIKDEQSLCIETYCRSEDLVAHHDIWLLLQSHGLRITDTNRIACYTAKYNKITEEFDVILFGEVTTRYIQFVCNIRKAKYRGAYFKKGDVLTLFFKDDKMPIPPLICIQPKANQTYVPMLPKQKLQIIVDNAQANMEWRQNSDSPIIFQRVISVNNKAASLIGTEVGINLFECIKEAKTQQVIFLNSLMGESFKTVCMPVINNKYALIFEPVGSFVLYSYNIDGFVLRTRNKFNLKIEDKCPLKVKSDLESKDFHEIKVEIENPCSAFIVEKEGNLWTAKIF